jgi:hypothetical protein
MSDDEDPGSGHDDTREATIRFAGRQYTVSRLVIGGVLLAAGAVLFVVARNGWTPGYFGAVVLVILGAIQILRG